MKNKDREDGGLEFMGLRMNVIDKSLELEISKQINPTESLLLRFIQLGTIGGRNRKRQICSYAEFYIKDFGDLLQTRMNKVYVHLKSLHAKELIIRIPTRSKDIQIIGLNPSVFGQILVNSQHEIEQKKHLSLVPSQDQLSPKVGPIKSQTRTKLVPSQDQIASEPIEIIQEKPLLDSYRRNKTVLEGKMDEISEEKNTVPNDILKQFPKWFRSMPKS